jgi:hypothetical protein
MRVDCKRKELLGFFCCALFSCSGKAGGKYMEDQASRKESEAQIPLLKGPIRVFDPGEGVTTSDNKIFQLKATWVEGPWYDNKSIVDRSEACPGTESRVQVEIADASFQALANPEISEASTLMDMGDHSHNTLKCEKFIVVEPVAEVPGRFIIKGLHFIMASGKPGEGPFWKLSFKVRGGGQEDTGKIMFRISRDARKPLP